MLRSPIIRHDRRVDKARAPSVDRIRDGDGAVRWQPEVEVTAAGVWAGPADDGRWVVGAPGRHVVRVDSPPGVIALLPLLERPLENIKQALGVSTLARHPLRFEQVVDAALSERSSSHWAALAIRWLADGFPTTWYQDALRRVAKDGRVEQRARQEALRLLARDAAT